MEPNDRINIVAPEEQVARHLREVLNFKMQGLKDADLVVTRGGNKDKPTTTITISKGAIIIMGEEIFEILDGKIAELTGRDYNQHAQSETNGSSYLIEASPADLMLNMRMPRNTV